MSTIRARLFNTLVWIQWELFRARQAIDTLQTAGAQHETWRLNKRRNQFVYGMLLRTCIRPREAASERWLYAVKRPHIPSNPASTSTSTGAAESTKARRCNVSAHLTFRRYAGEQHIHYDARLHEARGSYLLAACPK